MAVDPIAATGLLILELEDGEPAFLGTCAAVFREWSAVTAAHCVKGVEDRKIWLNFPRRPETRLVTDVRTHPTADLGVVRCGDGGTGDAANVFETILRTDALATDFGAYGYPVDGPTSIHSAPSEPTARAFRGHFQRFFDHRSHERYEYLAGELSIPVPQGLSGGPVFKVQFGYPLVAIATENLEVSTTPFSIEEEVGPAGTKRIEGHRVISYGVALMLAEFEDWLRSVVLT